jgi:hypothetical protein
MVVMRARVSSSEVVLRVLRVFFRDLVVRSIDMVRCGVDVVVVISVISRGAAGHIGVYRHRSTCRMVHTY